MPATAGHHRELLRSPWSGSVSLPRAHSTPSEVSDASGQSDASSTSYLITSSGLVDRPLSMMTAEVDVRDSSPQSTSCDGFERTKKMKPHRDPTSHRIIEKRRRDRMNNCLTNLSKLIPSVYLKKGRGRIEKTEIIEMAIRYMKHVELEQRRQKGDLMELQEELMLDKSVGTEEDECPAQTFLPNDYDSDRSMVNRNFGERYRQGFFDCIAETLRFLAGADGLVVDDQLKTRLLFHLRGYFNRLTYYDCPQSLDQSFSPNDQVAEAEDPDEPLNMCIRRPRVGGAEPPRQVDLSNQQLQQQLQHQYQQQQQQQQQLLQQQQQQNNQIFHQSSKLRDILESKPGTNRTANGGVGVVKREPPLLLPHSTFAPTHVQQKFFSSTSSSTSINDEKQTSLAVKSGFSAPVSSTGGGRSIGVGGANAAASSSSSSQYPSSPGSSVNSYESPPRLHSPTGSYSVPIFAWHPAGLFYVPLTVASHLLDGAFASGLTAAGVGPADDPGHHHHLHQHHHHLGSMPAVTHPVTINVNFNFLPGQAAAAAAVAAAAAAAEERSVGVCRMPAGRPTPPHSVILNTSAYASVLKLALKH